jgi:flagellar basal-body rod modification protein FlgD
MLINTGKEWSNMSVSEVNSQKTIQDIIDSSSKNTQGRKTGELGKDDFLNLLITQLRYQDPMNPVDDKEFIGQMAQFSALEQMQNMNNSISSTKAFGMIGKSISANIVDDVTKETKFIEGQVDSVKLDGGKTYLVVDGRDVPIERVSSVFDGNKMNNDSSISQYTGLIGYDAQGSVYDAKTGQFVGIEGIVMEIQKGKDENFAVMDGAKVYISSIDTEKPSTDPGFREKYLSDNIGKEVNVIISDGYDQEVPVTAILRDFKVTPNGKTIGVLDRLHVPVDSIHNIKVPQIAE